jgi:hypothetical protein
MKERLRLQLILDLTQAIGEDSKSIAMLLEGHGPRRAFKPEHAKLFEELIRHRKQLIVLLQAQGEGFAERRSYSARRPSGAATSVAWMKGHKDEDLASEANLSQIHGRPIAELERDNHV